MKKIALLAFITLSINSYSYSQSKDDTIAVKQLVEKESATWLYISEKLTTQVRGKLTT